MVNIVVTPVSFFILPSLFAGCALSPPTCTTICVPAVSQGLVGKQQLESCNYSLNIQAKKHNPQFGAVECSAN